MSSSSHLPPQENFSPGIARERGSVLLPLNFDLLPLIFFSRYDQALEEIAEKIYLYLQVLRTNQFLRVVWLHSVNQNINNKL